MDITTATGYGKADYTGERMDRTIICMKWGTLYSADYVNVLYNAVRANLHCEFRFVCLTDDPTRIHSEVETYPIPEFDLREDLRRIGGWPKIGIFKKDLYGLRGRALFIDLDMVIIKDLSPFFDLSGGLIATDMGDNWRPGQRNHVSQPGTCIFAFTLGEQPHVYERFISDPNLFSHEYGLEQNFVANHALDVSCWPIEWVISFKRHLRRQAPFGMIGSPKLPPAEAKIVAFHGKPRPHELIKNGWWGDFPNLGRGPVPWMQNYWNKYIRME